MSALFSEPVPLGVYIHLPWCVRKCPYCDFNSHAQKSDLPEQRYVDALVADLEQKLPLVWGRRITSVFIGGGTPSLFSAPAMARLLNELRQRLPLTPDTEITMEANPGTFEMERFRGFREAGINRLSVGIQSFSDKHLTALGRIHSGDDAKKAVVAAREAGFENINIDLMFALPEQTAEQSTADLSAAIALEPQHLSFYQLTLEPNTEFYVRPPPLPDDDHAWQMQQSGVRQLAEAGFERYEVSAYSKRGRSSRHNTNYWEFGDYLGLGAGAHGKLTDPASATVTRHHNHRHPELYMNSALAGDAVSGLQVLTPNDLTFEFMLNALRLTEGVEGAMFQQRTGLEPSVLEPLLDEVRRDGLLKDTPDRWVATDRGYQYLNELVMRFLSDG